MKQIILALISFALFAGCGGRNSTHVHDHDHDHDHDHADHSHAPAAHTHGPDCDHDYVPVAEHAHGDEHPAGEIVFTRAQADAAGDFALHRVTPGTFYEVIPCGGQILAAQGDEAAVVASFSGVVAFPAKKIAAGTSVNRGETLFYISSRDIAEGDYAARTEAAYQQAKAAYERAEALLADRIVTRSEYEAAKLAYENASAARTAISGRSSARGTSVSAPLGGYIKDIAVAEGQYVEVGQVLATVSQNRRLTLRADLSQRHAAALKTLSGANFRTPYDGQTYALTELNGRLLSAGRTADGNSPYLPVTFEFDNRGEVLSGSFVEVFLTGTPKPDAITVPLTALTEEQGNFFVFKQFEPEIYLKQGVVIGGNDGRSAEVLSGLHAGDVVVSRGAALVKMASFSAAIPHGHTH